MGVGGLHTTFILTLIVACCCAFTELGVYTKNPAAVIAVPDKISIIIIAVIKLLDLILILDSISIVPIIGDSGLCYLRLRKYYTRGNRISFLSKKAPEFDNNLLY